MARVRIAGRRCADMRRKEREVTDQKTLEMMISKAEILHLAMVDADGPYVVPLNFGYAKGFFYVHGAREGRKIDAVRHDNRVCFALHSRAALKTGESPCAFGMIYESVVGFGKAEIVTQPVEKKFGLRAIFSQLGVHFDSSMDFRQEHLDNTVVIRIDVQSISGKRSQ